MSELQLGLLAIGAVIVIGVLAYNRAQERRAGREAQRAFRSGHADALLEEPAPRSVQLSVETPRSVSLPDPGVDYVIELTFAEPIAPAVWLEHWKEHEHRFAGRAILAGTADGSAWRPVHAGEGGALHALRAGLQLVSRDGVVSEAELIEFRSALETLAVLTRGTVSAPEMRAAVEAARELDRFCAETDVQVVLHIVPPEGVSFPAGKVRAVAEASGMTATQDGRYVLKDDAGRTLYAISPRGDAPGLTVTLDVPRTPDTRRSYQSMASFARQLAVVLGASLADDNGTVLDERAVAAIGVQVEAVRARFEHRGITPGSAQALRVFP